MIYQRAHADEVRRQQDLIPNGVPNAPHQKDLSMLQRNLSRRSRAADTRSETDLFRPVRDCREKEEDLGQSGEGGGGVSVWIDWQDEGGEG